MAPIVKKSSSIVKASKFFSQKKTSVGTANRAKVQSKSLALVPKRVQTNPSPPGKIVKSPPGALVKYDNAIRINPTSIKQKNNPILKLLLQIEIKTILIDKILRSSLNLKKKQLEKGRIKTEETKFDKREKDLEGRKKSVPGLPKMRGGMLGGFFDRVKRFFFFTMLGWLFFRILPLLPKLKGLLGIITKAIDFAGPIFSGILSLLVNGFTTFLTESIKFINAIEKTIGWISGARTKDDFEKFEKTFNRLIDLTILAAMLTADAGFDMFKKGGGKGGRGGGKPGTARPRPGQGGRPKITTSGGKSAGRYGGIREGIRKLNPFRQKPGVTTSGGRSSGPFGRIQEGVRNLNPFRQKPGVTTSGGRSAGPFGGIQEGIRNLNPFKEKPRITTSGGKGTGIFGEIGEGIRNLNPFKKGARITGGEVPGGFRLPKMPRMLRGAGGFIGKLAEPLLILDLIQQTQKVFNPNDNIITAVSDLGRSISNQFQFDPNKKVLYDVRGDDPDNMSRKINERQNERILKEREEYNKKNKSGYSEGGIIGYLTGGFIAGKAPTRTGGLKKEIKAPDKIQAQKTRAGKDVGGEQNIKKIFFDTSPEEITIFKTVGAFLNPIGALFSSLFGGGSTKEKSTTKTKKSSTDKAPNPFKLLLNTSRTFKESGSGIVSSSLDFIGQIAGSAIDILLGQKPGKSLYRSVASGILYLANTIANKHVNGIKNSITSTMGFASGGEVPKTYASIASDDIIDVQETTIRSLSNAVETTMEQRSNKVLESVRGEIRKSNSIKPQSSEESGSISSSSGGAGGFDGGGFDGGSEGGTGGSSGGGQDSGSAGGTAGGYSPKGLQGDIYKYLLSKGMDNNHALGIMANISRESEFRPGVSEQGGVGIGLFQYTSEPRRSNFLKAVPDYKSNWKAQIDFAIREDYGPNYLRKKYSSPQEAADQWMLKWERPAERIQNGEGQEIHRKYLAGLEKYKTKDGQYTIPTSQQTADGKPGKGISIGDYTIDTKNNFLKLAGTSKLTRGKGGDGHCTENVLFQLDDLGINLAKGGTTADSSNPRGLVSQLVGNHGFTSIPGLGNEQTIRSPYGNVKARVIPFADYQAAVNKGLIPSGAFIFSTQYDSWNKQTGGSHGFDTAISRDGGRIAWNGKGSNTNAIYGASTQSVIVLIPKSSIKQNPRNPVQSAASGIMSMFGGDKKDNQASKPSGKSDRAWWDPRRLVGMKEGGVVEAKMGKSNVKTPIPNSFASYEKPGNGKVVYMMQKVIVEKEKSNDKSKKVTPSHAMSSKLNSSKMDRMQSTSRN